MSHPDEIIENITSSTGSGSSVINKNQYLSVIDVLSEGPIEGLPSGAASIYLDSNVASDSEYAAQTFSNGPGVFTFDGTTTVTTSSVSIPNFGGPASMYGYKYLRVLNFYTKTGTNAVRANTTTTPSITITTSSAFFTNIMKQDLANSPNNQPMVRLEIEGLTFFNGYITNIASTTVATAVPVGGVIPNKFVDKTSGEYSVIIDGSFKVSTIISNVITLLSSTGVPTGDFSCDLSHTEHFGSFANNNIISDTSKYKGFSYQFRNGTLYQPPINDIYGGSGATSITENHNEALEYDPEGAPSTWPDTSGGTPVYLTSSSMDLSVSTARQVDEVRLIFSYPAFIQQSNTSQEKYHGIQAYKIEIAIDKGEGYDSPVQYQNYKVDGEFYYHRGFQSNSFYIQETLDLERFKPFKDFQLKITKATRDDVGINEDKTYDGEGDNTVSMTSVLSSTVCILKERFTYPWTAYANVRVDAESFNSVPKRSYQCRGRLVLIPSNYVTREESDNGVANYRRNPSSGVVHATQEQDWDGNFRANIVYTNNPAWVFFDILNNSRYGLGSWLKYSDIDVFSLYRIAKYCDELVPDGKGGKEPRFVANIYLTKATEAYKVLKDMATTFRSILYWSEGNIVPVVDQAKEPVYNFTKGNVIEGKFQYEGTGSKLRSNRVVVTWNNPDNNYTAEALLVEDKQNIVETGKIISEEAVAFGATSIGQATRYGRWKLWTAINQSEVVSFKTAINASFLNPGDIVNVQDGDRYDVAYSGRVSNTGTSSTTSTPLDRTITLNSGSSYELSVMIVAPVAFLAQDGDSESPNTGKKTRIVINAGSFRIGKSYTIVTAGDTDFTSIGAADSNVDTTFTATGVGTGTGTAYHDFEKGDIIPGYTTELAASNIQDINHNIVEINWAPYTHVETQAVSSTGSTSVLVSTAFTVAAEAESIWVLREIVTSTGVIADASKKAYKILSIKEGGKNSFDIQAVEHYNQKFTDIDIDFGQPYVDTMLLPGDFVPAPTNISITTSE